jgi:predicted 2-oxoglutarate/Fe(II)-dependent dioxygenase YbiX
MSITFDLPDIKCKYLIDENEYGSLTDLLQKPFEQCKVGKKDGDYDLPEVRSGKFRNTKIVFENQKELNLLILSQLEEFSWLRRYKEYLEFDINNNYQVLKYEENDFFNRHQDNISNIRHFGTLLIFPPAIGELEHQGGKLVLDEINDEFDSSSNTSWKAVILFCEIFHEIEKVTSGQRVVLKTKLLFNEDYDSDIEQDINSNVMDVGMSDYAW